MYKKRTSTKKGRKAPYKRRIRDGHLVAPRSIQLSSWSQPFRTTLKYSDVVLLATSTGTGFTTYVLQPNSIFDFDLTGVGHQPLRFDQIAAMFNAYRVRSCQGRFNFSTGAVSTSSSALGPWRCTITKSKSNTTLPGTGTDYNTAAEMDGSATGVMTTQQHLTLYQNYKWEECGTNTIEEMTNNVTGSPAIPFYWILSVYNQGNVASTSTLVNFDIQFDVEFTNPKTIATS